MNNYFRRIRYQVNFGLLKTINILYCIIIISYIIRAPATWTSYELLDTRVVRQYNNIILWPSKTVAIFDNTGGLSITRLLFSVYVTVVGTYLCCRLLFISHFRLTFADCFVLGIANFSWRSCFAETRDDKRVESWLWPDADMTTYGGNCRAIYDNNIVSSLHAPSAFIIAK